MNTEIRNPIANITADLAQKRADRTSEDLFGPPPTDLVSVGLASLGSLIGGFLGGLFILIFSYFFLGGVRTSTIFPYILPLVALFAILLTSSTTLMMERMLFPDKYKQGSIAFAQMSIFSIFAFVITAPLYIYVGSMRPDFLILVFTIHILLNFLATSLLVEILSNYRYILLSIYGSFVGFFLATALSVVFFLGYSPSQTALYSLIGVIMVVNLVITLCRSLFEYGYYRLYLSTGTDHLGDIFSRIELEEKEAIAKAEKEMGRFE